VAVEKLKRVYGVEVELRTQRSPTSRRSRGKPKPREAQKQTGGRGQYGDCWIRLEPQPRGKGFEYVDGIVGGSIRANTSLRWKRESWSGMGKRVIGDIVVT